MGLPGTRDVALCSRGASSAAFAKMDKEEGVTYASLGSQRSGWQMFQTPLLLFVISGQHLPEVAGSHQKMGQPLLCPRPILKQLLPLGPVFLHPLGEREFFFFCISILGVLVEAPC